MNREGWIGIAGAGAFGTALAVALAEGGRSVTLWARDAAAAARMHESRENPRLPGIRLPDGITVSAVIDDLWYDHPVLLAVPAQALRGFLTDHAAILFRHCLVACSKGVDLETLQGPSAIIRSTCKMATPAVLTGPSFAADIARGLPTALTLACDDDATGAQLQAMLSTPALRLYRTTDLTGAELGGALKNVVAIAAGVVAGAGLGESARAALVTRGFAEMTRAAVALGAKAETLTGLSGLGDLMLTCFSEQSRNLRFGLALGRGESFPAGVTVEGAATARAMARLAAGRGIEMPVTAMVAALLDGTVTVPQAMQSLMSRPLKQE